MEKPRRVGRGASLARPSGRHPTCCRADPRRGRGEPGVSCYVPTRRLRFLRPAVSMGSLMGGVADGARRPPESAHAAAALRQVSNALRACLPSPSVGGHGVSDTPAPQRPTPPPTAVDERHDTTQPAAWTPSTGGLPNGATPRAVGGPPRTKTRATPRSASWTKPATRCCHAARRCRCPANAAPATHAAAPPTRRRS